MHGCYTTTSAFLRNHPHEPSDVTASDDMAAPNPAAEAGTKIQIAEAKAELAVMLTDSFREDINSLRDALQHANQLIATLQDENARLKAALSSADPSYTFDDAPRAPSPAPVSPVAVAPETIRPDMQTVPPEGTIFSNGGAYVAAKTGERATNNVRLKRELNDWTRARGYSVKIFRSRLEKKRAKLIISCILAGAPKYRAGRQETAEEQQQRREMAQEAGGSFRKQRVSRLQDCPLRFTLLEIVPGSGTFVVKHLQDRNTQRCNHGPDHVGLDSDGEI